MNVNCEATRLLKRIAAFVLTSLVVIPGMTTASKRRTLTVLFLLLGLVSGLALPQTATRSLSAASPAITPGVPWAWGRNHDGQLGMRTRLGATSTQIIGLSGVS